MCIRDSAYYDYFTADNALKELVFQNYFIYNPAAEDIWNENNHNNSDEISQIIVNDICLLYTSRCV